MEVLNFIDPPNKPKDTIYVHATSPTLYPHFIDVHVNEKGELLINSTDVSSSFWESSIYYYRNYKCFIEETFTGRYSQFCIINTAKFYKDYALIAEFPAFLKVLGLAENNLEAVVIDSQQHLEDIKNISLWNNADMILSSGNNYITIWDIQETFGLRKKHDFFNYHTDDITSISCNRLDANMFTSCGYDRRVIVWDQRIEMPATEIYMNEFCTLTSIGWNPVSKDNIVVSTEAGDIYSLDITQPKEFLSVERCYNNKSVHKIAFNDTGLLAVCGDTTEVQIYDCANNNFNLIKTSNDHKRYVRGLSWYGNWLYTCGFDTQVNLVYC